MSSAATHPEPPDLTPAMAEKIREVEHEIDRLRLAAATQQKWFLLGLIPYGIRVLCIGGITLSLVGALFQMHLWVSSTESVTSSGIWFWLLNQVGSIAASLFILLISTWAFRYCQARADGKL